MTTPHLLQVFLGNNGVHEVSVTPGDRELSCTCAAYARRQSCRHTRYIYEHATPDGSYLVPLSEVAMNQMADSLTHDPVAWRMFVIENAPVVVL